MFDKLLDWLFSMWEHLWPFFIIKEYEEGVVLRNGKFHRVVLKGLHRKWPFIEEILTQHTVITTLSIPAQSLVTTDNSEIVVESVVKYKIADTKTFLLEVYDTVDAVSDVTQGIIKNVIMSSTWQECRDVSIDKAIEKKVRAELKKFGVYVDAVTLTSISKIRTYRLINQAQSLLPT